MIDVRNHNAFQGMEYYMYSLKFSSSSPRNSMVITAISVTTV